MAIETTGALRRFVADTMEQVRDGGIELDRADVIVRLAGRVNDSIFAEAKVQRLLLENGQPIGRMGTQPIGEPEPAVKVA